MRKFLALLCCTTIALPALAAEPDEHFFADYMTLVSLLRSEGIEPGGVDWLRIKPMCLGLKSETDQIAYNRCLYNKAMNLQSYNDDVAICNQNARGAYPDALLRNQTIVTDNITTATITQPALTRMDLNAKRQGAFNNCMTGKNWRDVHNFARGKTND